MNVRPITLNLHLPDDQLLDLFLFQWHRPEPLAPGELSKIPADVAQAKRGVLQQFRECLIRRDADLGVTRPAFIVFPELSLPQSGIPEIEALLTAVRRPLVLIAGIEHLTWSEYEVLAGAMSDTPENESCPAQERSGKILNVAAIWVRDENRTDTGEPLRFLQSKLHPADQERPRLHSGQNVLVFTSRDQTAGRRLNFCVQICSDFCRQDRVLALRKSIEAKCPGLPLDFTFLPQHNPNQEATRFREATEAYFRAVTGATQTPQGCLVMVNNASERQGKAEPYGGARVSFPYGRWRKLRVPPCTCFIRDYETHQAVVVREPGPGVYHLLYKPHCWIDRRPGGDQAEPFLDTAFLPIDNGQLASDFSPLWPERHWLRNEWAASAGVFVSDIRANSRQHVGLDHVVGICERAYYQSSAIWYDYLAVHPEMTRFALNLYFSLWKKEPDSPGREPEPQFWSSDVATGVRKFMESFCLLKLGEAGAPGGELVPHCEQPSWHAMFGNEVRILFLWGKGRRKAEAMIAECRNLTLTVSLLTSKVLFLLVDPIGAADADSLRKELTAEGGNIAAGRDLRGLPAHLHTDGEVVDPRYARDFNMICNHALLDKACAAAGEVDLRSALADVLRTELC